MTEKTYKWRSPHDWLAWKTHRLEIEDGDTSGHSPCSRMKTLLWPLVNEVFADTIQDHYQAEMAADGYFEPVEPVVYLCRSCCVELGFARRKHWKHPGTCPACGEGHVLFGTWYPSLAANRVIPLSRERVVETLENYGIECYDHEELLELKRALIANIEDGTIPEEEVEHD